MVARREPTEAVRISEPREDRNQIFYLKSYDFQMSLGNYVIKCLSFKIFNQHSAG